MAAPVVAGRQETSITTAATTGNIGLPFVGQACLLIAVIRIPSGGITSFAGWTLLTSSSADAGSGTTYIYYRTHDGSGGNAAWGTSVSTKMAAIVIAVTGYRDPAIQAPEISAIQNFTTTVNGANPASLSPTGGSKDYLWLAVMTKDGFATGIATATPSGFTDLTTANTGSASTAATNANMATAERTSTASIVDPGVFTHPAASAGGSSWTIAIHPLTAPVISSITPTSGPVGTQVSISGTGFQQADSPVTQVAFASGGVSTTFAVQSDILIYANAPSGAPPGTIHVLSAGGTGVSAQTFTVTAIYTKTAAFRLKARHSGTSQITQGAQIKALAFKLAANISATGVKQAAAQIKSVAFLLASRYSVADAITKVKALAFKTGLRHSDADQATLTRGTTLRLGSKLSGAEATIRSRAVTFRLQTKFSVADAITKIKTLAFRLATRVGLASSKSGTKGTTFRLGTRLSQARNLIVNRSGTFRAGTRFSGADAWTLSRSATFRVSARFSGARAITRTETVGFRHAKKLSGTSLYVPSDISQKTISFRRGSKFSAADVSTRSRPLGFRLNTKFSGAKVYIPAVIYTKAATFKIRPKFSAVQVYVQAGLPTVLTFGRPKLVLLGRAVAAGKSSVQAVGRPKLILKGRPCTARGCPPAHSPTCGQFIVGDGTVCGQWFLPICQVPLLILKARSFGIQNVAVGDVTLSFNVPRLMLLGKPFARQLSTSPTFGRPKLILLARFAIANPSYLVKFNRPLLILKGRPVTRTLSNSLALGRPKLILLGRPLIRVGAPGLVPSECQPVTLAGTALQTVTITPEACQPVTLGPTTEEDETLAPTTEEDALLVPSVPREL